MEYVQNDKHSFKIFKQQTYTLKVWYFDIYKTWYALTKMYTVTVHIYSAYLVIRNTFHTIPIKI